MIMAFTGHLGSGKTLGLTYFAWLTSFKAGGVPILANYPMREEFFARHRERNGRFRLYHLQSEDDWLQFAAGGGGVVALDELHRLVDSRTALSAQNVILTQFMAFLRKIGATTLCTDQHAAFMDVRMRVLIDAWVRCSKVPAPGGAPAGYRYDAADQYGKPTRSLFLPAEQVRPLWDAYDTRQIIRGFQFPRTMAAFDKFLDRLDVAVKSHQERHGVAVAPAPAPADLDRLLGVG